MRWPHRRHRRRLAAAPVPAPAGPIVQCLPLYVPSTHRVVEGELRYDPADPYAVELVVESPYPDGPCAAWTFARDLLAGGLSRPTGAGTVRVAPAPRPTRIVVELAFADGFGTADTLRQFITDFLDRSYALVPVGTESDRVDLDTALAGLRDHDGDR
jgi:hypothetical protein